MLSSTDLYTTKLENMGKDTWSSLVVPWTDIDVYILYSHFANWSVFIPKKKYLQAIFILLLPNSLSFKARLVLRIRSTSLIMPGSDLLRSIWTLCIRWNARSARRKLFLAIKRETTNNVFYWGFVSGLRASELAMIFAEFIFDYFNPFPTFEGFYIFVSSASPS